jgi:hypothetical protein
VTRGKKKVKMHENDMHFSRSISVTECALKKKMHIRV